MKKYIYTVIILLCIVGLIGLFASKTNIANVVTIGHLQNNPEQLIVNMEQLEMKDMKFSDLFSEVEIVPLEATKNSLIGDVFTVRMYNDTLYVFDDNTASALFLFTKEGKFIRRIGKRGKGPGEYLFPDDFTVDMDCRTVSFLCMNSHRVIVYNMEGKHMKDIKLSGDFFCTNFIATPEFIYATPRLYRNNDKKQFSLYSFDKKGTPIMGWFNLSSFNKGLKSDIQFNKTCFFNYQNEIRFWNYFNDTIYSIVGGKIQPHIILRSKNQIDSKDIKQISKRSNLSDPVVVQDIYKLDKFFGVDSYLENRHWVYFFYRKGYRSYNVLVDKENKTTIKTFLKDDMTGLHISPFEFCTDKYFVKYLLSNHLSQLKENSKEKSFSSFWQNKDFLRKSSLNENPIILLYKLK